jgi:precorrin-2 dehydrogenase/sirohydrochlorin ferrochelatase
MKLPIYIDVEGYKVLILGGGYEATKKARRLLEYGADITIYSLEFTSELGEMADQGLIKIIYGDVRDLDVVEKLILGSDIVIYTVPNQDDIEDWVCRICKEHRKLYIISTNASVTQAALPVEMELHGLRFTVFSDGKSTLVALRALDLVRECLEDRKDLEVLLEAMYYLKVYMKERGVPYKVRMKLYRDMIRDERLLRYVRMGDVEKALSYIRDVVDNL